MRKIILILAVLAVASPAMAAVTITCTPDDGGVVTVSFTNDSGRVRAFALDIAVDGGAIIEPNSASGFNADYSIYPGSIEINSVTGEVDANGSPVCGSDYPGTEPGPGTASMTIEMGSLYVGEGNAPGQDDDLLTFVVDCNGAADCNVTVALNTIRGGVVMENGDSVDPGPGGLVGCKAVCAGQCRDQFGTATQAYYDKYVTAGKNPGVWCTEYHCYGDADDAEEYVFPVGWYRIYNIDLTTLILNWQKKVEDANPDNIADPAADFSHSEEYVFPVGYYAVYNQDLTILITNWKATSDGLTSCAEYLP